MNTLAAGATAVRTLQAPGAVATTNAAHSFPLKAAPALVVQCTVMLSWLIFSFVVAPSPGANAQAWLLVWAARFAPALVGGLAAGTLWLGLAKGASTSRPMHALAMLALVALGPMFFVMATYVSQYGLDALAALVSIGGGIGLALESIILLQTRGIRPGGA